MIGLALLALPRPAQASPGQGGGLTALWGLDSDLARPWDRLDLVLALAGIGPYLLVPRT